MTRAPEEPFLVTTAGKSPRDEQRQRTRRYLLTMGLRTIIFIAAIVLYTLHLHVAAVVTGAASLILPWIAVVAANAGPTRTIEHPALYQRDEPKQLGRGER